MVEKFGVEKAEGHQLLRWCQPSLQVNEPQTPEEEEDMLGFPYREALIRGAHVDSNDNTARHCVRGERLDQVLEPWTVQH